VVSPRLWKLAAIPIGLALACIPAVAVNAWLYGYLERQGIGELDRTGRRVMGLAEARLIGVIAALDDLAARGVRSCADADRDAMHETSLRTVPIKEISVLGPDGDTRCTNLAIPLGQRLVVAPITNARSDIVIEVIRVGAVLDGVVRIRRATPDGTVLAALVPADIMMPQTSSNGGPHVVHAKLSASDGTVFGERNADDPNENNPSDSIFARIASGRFGLSVSTSMPRARAHAGHGDLVMMATIGTGTASALLIALVAFGPWRPRADPVSELADAIRNNELVPYYQPVVDLTSARIVGAEVLVRWRRPDGTLISPVQFIPLAESSGLILELTRALMRRVCAEAGAAIGARPGFRIGFNLSALHFADEAIVDDVKAIFGGSPIAIDQVLLEVTERQPLDNLTMARRVIAALQGLGASVGIDDLGTGHSGLSYMLKLGVDFIKLDKMFVDAIETERYSATIISTLVGLARDMRMDIIAEGVETFEQMQHLRERGIRKAQGYLFAPPLPGSSFLRLLAASDALPSTAHDDATADGVVTVPSTAMVA
jgi:sensor c-di-GMP phosphodiesterase-like protein